MELTEIARDIVGCLLAIDASRAPFRGFQPGVGPYGEPQLLKQIAAGLNQLAKYRRNVQTKRTPDLLIPGEWAIEFKIARPFGDNGKEAENWSVNLIHPYRGSASCIGDCFKLLGLHTLERKAIAVIGYEHVPAIIDLTPLVESFECVAKQVMHMRLSDRLEIWQPDLVHPVHQSLRLFAWEVLGG